MNNFDGQLNKYPEVCVDNFETKCLFNSQIKCYILSHFHEDHMHNLEDPSFYRLLKDGLTYGIQFLCSPITKKFISTCDKYSHLSEFCREICCETPVIVKISSKESITVTFCGSGHCPGSVMVFIEGLRGNVLFTGDFRLPLSSANRLPFLKKENSQNELKKVDDLYVDMTFFKPEILFIPSREDSVKALLKFIHSFLDKQEKAPNFKNLIYLKTSARIAQSTFKIGYEFLYQEIFKSTGFKIHVNNLIFRIYEKIPEIQSILTTDARTTPIHACIYEARHRNRTDKSDLLKSQLTGFNHMKTDSIKIEESMLPCELFALDKLRNPRNIDKELNCVKIILSTMWFTDTAGVDNIFVEFKPKCEKQLESVAYKYYKNIYRLCFSFHSSMEEIIDFVNTIQPKRLYSIALPEGLDNMSLNEYFFAADGSFKCFRLAVCSDKSVDIGKKATQILNRTCKPLVDEPLVLRKRKSLNSLIRNKNETDDSSSNESEKNSKDSYLNFGGSDEDQGCSIVKRFKKIT